MSVKDRGFASMKKTDPDRQKEIASAGGKAAHEQKTAHQWTKAEAREAGSKGGRRAKQKKDELARQAELAESLKEKL